MNKASLIVASSLISLSTYGQAIQADSSAKKVSPAKDTAVETITCGSDGSIALIAWTFDKEKISSPLSGRNDSASDHLLITESDNSVNFMWKEEVTGNKNHPFRSAWRTNNKYVTDYQLKKPIEQLRPSALKACKTAGVSIVRIKQPSRKDRKAAEEIRTVMKQHVMKF